MHPFAYTRAATIDDAVRTASGNATAKYIAGGTNLVDLMKETVEQPTQLIDITHLPLKSIEDTSAGGLRIGALVSNSDLARDQRIRERYRLLACAIRAGASPQLRNAATTGGNLLQRTRCYYFYDVATPCNKRSPGQGCGALHGVNRIHAILGASEHCIATHPSDMCVALAALEATVHVTGPNGARAIAFEDFHRLPRDRPDIDTTLANGELITAVELPPQGFAENFTYLKLRDRLSYAFALVSVAAALQMDGSQISDARIALGGVAHKPWRNKDAERLLVGKTPDGELFAQSAAALLSGARGFGHNDFKIELARRAIVRALLQAAAGAPQSQVDKRIG
jgi:xanthine dehydrogenase YagS FAD-binding subunit